MPGLPTGGRGAGCAPIFLPANVSLQTSAQEDAKSYLWSQVQRKVVGGNRIYERIVRKPLSPRTH